MDSRTVAPLPVDSTLLRLTKKTRCFGGWNSGAAVGAFALLLLLCACGGGGGATNPNPQPPAPPPDFTLAVEVASVTIQQQGSGQYQTVYISPVNGFGGTISVALQGLPAGVNASPASPYSYKAGGPVTGVSFQLSALSTATVGTSTITVTGTSGSITHSATFTVQVTAQAPFAIHVSPANLSLAPASVGTVQISLTANAGTSPSLQVSVSDLPKDSGLTLLYPQGFLSTSNPVSFTVEATALAQPVTSFPIVVTAQDASNNSSVATVPLTVSVPFSSSSVATRTSFVRTNDNPTGAYYDAARKLVFVTVQTLNEVLVLASTDGHRVTTIPVEQPFGIDETADGSQILVGSESPFLTVIDPDTLEVVRRVPGPVLVPQIGAPEEDDPIEPAALSNGMVLIVAQKPQPEIGIFHLYLWNPATGTMTLRDVTNLSPQTLQRSADHSKVVVWGDTSNGATAVIYDAASDSFNGPANFPGVSYLGINPDGSQIVAVGLQTQPTNFYDDQFNLLGSLPLDSTGGIGVSSGSSALYSANGKRLYIAVSYVFSTATVVATAVVDPTNYSLIGVVPDTQASRLLSPSIPFAVDETGMLFAGNLDGLELLDAGTPGFLKLPFPGSFQLQPASLSPSSPTQTQLNGAGFSSSDTYSVYFGAPPASPTAEVGTNVSVQSSTLLNVTAPPATKTGAANVTLTRPDGWFEVMPDAASYGPEVLFIDSSAGPASGGSTIYIYGYGTFTTNTRVAVGGSPATIIQNEGPGFLSPFPFPMDLLKVTTPAGSPGLADVTVKTPDGSTTVAGGFQYFASSHVYPLAGSLDDIIYDQARQRLWVTNTDHDRVEVFDLGSSSFLAPITVGNQPTSLALTPDGSMLAVMNSGDGTVSVIDPSTMQVTNTYPALTSADKDATSCGGVAGWLAPVEPHRMLVDVVCTALLASGTIHLLDLDTGRLSCSGIAGCDSTGLNIVFDSGLEAMASTKDGTEVFLSDVSGSSGEPLGWLNFTANSLTTGPSMGGDDAIDADGNLFVSGFDVFDQQRQNVDVLGGVYYREAGPQSPNNLTGESLNPSGSLLFVPQYARTNGNGVGMDIFDVHRGRVAMRMALPEQLVPALDPMALDETGTKMFLISNSGITIAQLAQAPLSIATVNPASGTAGTQVTIRGSGFENGATATFGTTQEVTTYVDSETLKATVPSLSAGPVRVTVTNPDGKSYSFDAAFTEN